MPTLKKMVNVRTADSAGRDRTSEAPTQSFTLVLAEPLTDEETERLYGLCDDLTVGVTAGKPYVAFDRTAPTLAQAILSGWSDLMGAVPSAQVVRIEPEELVNAAEIARRTGRSRASISQLAEGQRGPGAFPTPRVWNGARALWDWTDVAGWFASNDLAPATKPSVAEATFLSALNGALNLRRLAPKITDDTARRLVAGVVLHDMQLLVPTAKPAIEQIASLPEVTVGTVPGSGEVFLKQMVLGPAAGGARQTNTHTRKKGPSRAR